MDETRKIDVKDFGAVGDGLTDNTDAIQAAIDAAETNQIVLFPDGVYNVRGSIHIENAIVQGTSLNEEQLKEFIIKTIIEDVEENGRLRELILNHTLRQLPLD